MQVALGQTALLVLHQVQVFDQQGALTGAITQQGPDGCNLVVPEDATTGKRRGFATAGPWMDRATLSRAHAASTFRRVIHKRHSLT
jgi:hypothetical protein